MLIHFIKPIDYHYLEEKFSVLTPEGWLTPEWVKSLNPYFQPFRKHHENEIGNQDIVGGSAT